jgi:hypothetical protein
MTEHVLPGTVAYNVNFGFLKITENNIRFNELTFVTEMTLMNILNVDTAWHGT